MNKNNTKSADELVAFAQFELAQQSGWVKCEERLPERSDHYIATLKYQGRLFVAEIEWVGLWDASCLCFDEVIAWQELPEPCQEVDE